MNPDGSFALKSLVYAVTGRGERMGLWETHRFGIRDSTAGGQAPHLGAVGARGPEIFGAAAVAGFYPLAAGRATPSSPASCENQNRSQTLPKVPWGTEQPPLRSTGPVGQKLCTSMPWAQGPTLLLTSLACQPSLISQRLSFPESKRLGAPYLRVYQALVRTVWIVGTML